MELNVTLNSGKVYSILTIDKTKNRSFTTRQEARDYKRTLDSDLLPRTFCQTVSEFTPTKS